MHELQERNVTVVIAIEDRDHTLYQWVVSQFRDVEKLLWLKSTRLVLVDFCEVLVQLLQLFLREVEVLKLLLFSCEVVSHFLQIDIIFIIITFKHLLARH